MELPTGMKASLSDLRETWRYLNFASCFRSLGVVNAVLQMIQMMRTVHSNVCRFVSCIELFFWRLLAVIYTFMPSILAVNCDVGFMLNI